jgi:hypothetical protein
MKTFQQYLKLREMEGAEHGLGDLGSGDVEECLFNMAKVAIDDYRNDFLDLMSALSKKDERIRYDLSSYYQIKKGKKKKPGGNHVPDASEDDERDTVVPSSADTTSGAEPGGEDG